MSTDNESFRVLAVRMPTRSYEALEKLAAKWRTGMATIARDIIESHCIDHKTHDLRWEPLAGSTGESATIILAGREVAFDAADITRVDTLAWSTKVRANSVAPTTSVSGTLCYPGQIIACNMAVKYANGNPLDCRRENLLVLVEGDEVQNDGAAANDPWD